MKEYLRAHTVFEVLSDAEIDKLLLIASSESYAKNEIVFCEEQPSKRFFVLKKGKVRLNFGSEKAIEVNQSQIFGDWAMLSDTVRLATCTAILDTECIAIDYEKLKNPAVFPADIALKIVLQLTKPIIGRLQTPAQKATELLIAQGENQQVEFKESLRMNKFTQTKDDKMEFASLKTVAGFLNSQGGVLFIGVADDGSIAGLENDHFDNTDKLLLHLSHLINHTLGKNAASYVSVSPLMVQEKLILRVDCSPSAEPVFLNDKNQQYFFVRQSAQTLSFNIQETVNYIQSHF